MARDGIGRFWRPIDFEKSHMLHMCAVIDPNQSLVTEESSTSETDDNVCTMHDDDDDDFAPIHYINCDELRSSLHSQLRCHSRHDKLDHSLEKMRDMIRDTPDLLFRIQADGSLTFWGVQVGFFLFLKCNKRNKRSLNPFVAPERIASSSTPRICRPSSSTSCQYRRCPIFSQRRPCSP
ncbi:hypothetical protein BJV82DRAFT_55686 [Fennellomyces sp. T-0311]|nr:hypothetical protein BJV82DRAFT_55686 [Fennellomyces sp. T-0311]